MRNFNDILRKDVFFDNIKKPRKQGFILSPENLFLGKIKRGGSQFDPSPPAFLGLRETEPFKHTWKIIGLTIIVKSTLKLFVVTIDHKIELDTKSL